MKVRSILCFFFSSRRRHTRWNCDWSSDVCSSDLGKPYAIAAGAEVRVDGAKVGLARGFPQALLSAAATSATRFEAKPPAAVAPLGELPADAQLARARVVD